MNWKGFMAGRTSPIKLVGTLGVCLAMPCQFFGTIASGQVSLLSSAGTGPQADTRDELDEVGLVYGSPDPQATLDRATAFVRNYPSSQFLEVVELTKMDAYRELGRMVEAASSARLVLGMNPANPFALVSLAEVLLSEDLTSEPNRRLAEKNARLGVSILDGLAKPEGARSREWLEAKKELLARAHGILGYLLLKEARFEEAAVELQNATNLESSATYFYRLGLANQLSGHAGQATEAFERARDLGSEEVRRSAEARLQELSEQEP